MRKKLLLTEAVLIIVLSITMVCAYDVAHFDAYESDLEILINGEKVNFNLPVVTINDSTYVSIREMAGKIEFDVEYDENHPDVRLYSRTPYLDAKMIYNHIFQTQLLESVEVLNYDFSYAFGPTFYAKFAFDKKDLEEIESLFIFRKCPECNEDNSFPVKVYSYDYEWWDLLDEKNAISTYYDFVEYQGRRYTKSWIYITEGENGKCYLYVASHEY